jgi:Ca-activated chloride channel family protein
LRPEEPQSYRDLALVLGREKHYQRAIELLYRVVLTRWDRFPEIELTALTELNNLIVKARAAGQSGFAVDPRLVRNLDLDVRIVLTWDADLTDMDLWVIEPSAEKAYYGHPGTTIGGLVSKDFTQGYGPEEYLLHRAMRGMYKVQTNFYGSQAQTLIGAVTVQLTLYTNYGRPNEKRRAVTLRLTDKKETLTVGVLEF